MSSESSLPASMQTTTAAVDASSEGYVVDYKIWLIGLAFVTLISFCAAVGIIIMPLIGSRRYKRMLSWFVGLGVGSLSGSAIFHLLPSAVDVNVTSGNNAIRLWLVLAGIYVFYIVENLIKIVSSKRKVSSCFANVVLLQGAAQPKDVISRLQSDSFKSEISLETVDSKVNAVSLSAVLPLQKDFVSPVDCSPTKDTSLPNGSASNQQTDNSQDLRLKLFKVTSDIRCPEHSHGDGSGIASVAWMIIIGDSIHNFIDGLSIGAAFSRKLFTGISISVAVFCEEFPHELGDVAILISSGMSIKQALFYNVLSALTCYLGFIVGMIVGELGTADRLIFSFAGGMFLFISLGNMIPEMSNRMQQKLNSDSSNAVKLFFIQCSGILAGLVCLFLLAQFGDQIV
ncbi:Zinc transporter ZIP14 [Trichuris trichiura]|uniref:Zinc transporter ZIP14 n=1 Tax=Trichuris trichiura TaxID=36087 RepID=A0A077YY40_TRITR|nr:Zinc transporter ZIP14 [Trichuris trichiura]